MKVRIALAMSLLSVLPAAAAVVSDPAGDFIPTYTGPAGGDDLDAVSSEVTVNTLTNTVKITGTMNAAIGTTTGAFYVWGLDRGAGTERFTTGTPSVGAGVKFDLVVILRPDGTAQVNDLVGAVNTTLAAGSALVSGSTISSVDIPLSLFPSRGLGVTSYSWNLWPRVSTVSGNAAISDFAPNASNAAVTVVPEPAAAGAAVAGAASLLLAGRRRRI